MINVKAITSEHEMVKMQLLDSYKNKKNISLTLLVSKGTEIQNFITDKLCPVFKDVEKQLSDDGYSSRLGKTMVEIDHSGEERVTGLKFSVSVKKADPVHDQYIEFIGDYTGPSIECEIKTYLNAEPQPCENSPLVIKSYNQEKIERNIEDFLKRAFYIDTQPIT